MAIANDELTASWVFAGWTLHGYGRLTGQNVDLQLPPKEWHVMRLLLASGGALMTKDHLLESAWPRREVSEESLTRCIYSLRKHLKTDKGFIKTIYGKGYRFTCAVNVQFRPLREGAHGTRLCSACGQVQHD